jgi:hypothetical protein
VSCCWRRSKIGIELFAYNATQRMNRSCILGRGCRSSCIGARMSYEIAIRLMVAWTQAQHNSPSSEQPRQTLPSLSSCHVLLRLSLERGFFPAVHATGSVASSPLHAARQSLQQSIPKCLTYCNKSSFPRESSLCPSPTPNRCK